MRACRPRLAKFHGRLEAGSRWRVSTSAEHCKCWGRELSGKLLTWRGDSRETSRYHPTYGPIDDGVTRWVTRTGGGTQAPRCFAVAPVNRLGTAHSVFEY